MKAPAGKAKYNLARVYMDKGQPRLALPMFEELYKEQPEQARFAQHLAQCYFGLQRIEDAKRVLIELMNRPPAPPEKAEAKGEQPASNGNRESAIGVPAAATSPGVPQAPSAPTAAEAQKTHSTEAAKPAGSSPPSPIDNGQSSIENSRRPWADWLMGVIQFEEGRIEEALESLLRAEESDPRIPDLHLRIGQTYLRLRRVDDAERAFRKALEIDGDSPEAHLGLAMVLLRKRRNEEAVEEALIAVSLQHFLPAGHFYLGVALARLGHFHRATLAFETTVTVAPGFLNAHRWLIARNSRPGGDLAKATRHRKLVQALIERRREMTRQ